MKKSLMLILCLAFTVGCAAVPIKPTQPDLSSHIFSSPYDEVWTAVVNVMSSEGYLIILAEKDSGLIETDWVMTSSYGPKYGAKLTGDGSYYSSERAKISIHIQQKTEGVEVRITPHIELFYLPRLFEEEGWLPTDSNGILERALFEKIGQLVAPVAPAAPAVPLVPAAPTAPVAPAAPTGKNVSGEEYVINIPNSDGSFTPVKLKKSDNGYIGPQGESYQGHPSIEQLKVLYGK
jgi:hypothetical protein